MKIDFYVLNDDKESHYNLFVCKLIDKIYRMDMRIYIHFDSHQQAAKLDSLLWTFNPGSFLPHEILESATNQNSIAAIILGYNAPPSAQYEVLINLSQQVPAFVTQFQRVAEFVNSNKNITLQARERFRNYQKQGFEITTHNIGS